MIEYKIKPNLSDVALNYLFTSAWKNYSERKFRPILRRSLSYIAAFHNKTLIGFVNVAWDGGIHSFILDTTVHPNYQHKGIGTELMRIAALVAKEHSVEWLHVDYEPHLQTFYEKCGYQKTEAGLLHLIEND